jgi:sulfur relay protein TusB/DsrH
MTTLFIINRAVRDELRACCALLREGDAMLFIEDGVYLLSAPLEGELVQTLDKYHCFALRDDLVARGISAKIPPQITLAGYPDFVALTLQYARVVNW